MRSRYTYIVTYLTEFSLLAAGILVYRFAYDLPGDTDFASYSLVRRNLSFFMPLMFLGLAVGIPRFVSFNLGDNKKNGGFFMAGTIILLVSVVIICSALIIFKGTMAELLFGDRNFSYLIYPFVTLIIGIAMHSLAYSYLRGLMQMNTANALQFINLGIGVVAAFFLSHQLTEVIYFTGFFWIFTASIFMIYIYRNISFNKKELIANGQELFKYSIARVPGDMAMAALFSLPSLFITHYFGIIPAGYLAFGITLLNMAGAAFSPVSLLLLPKISKLASEKKYRVVFSNTDKIILVTLLLSVVVITIFEFFATPIIHLYLKGASAELINTARIVALGIPGYTIYIVLRSVLDALHVKAVNSRNLLISFIFYCLSIGILFLLNFDEHTKIYLNIWMFSASLTLLGILTYFDLLKSKKFFINK